MNIKLSFNDDIRKLNKKPSNYIELLELVNKTYKDLNREDYDIKYEDYDHDMITITSEEDFQSALDFIQNESIKCLKLYLLKKKDHFESVQSQISKEEKKSDYKLTVNPDNFNQGLLKSEEIISRISNRQDLSNIESIENKKNEEINENLSVNPINNFCLKTLPEELSVEGTSDVSTPKTKEKEEKIDLKNKEIFESIDTPPKNILIQCFKCEGTGYAIKKKSEKAFSSVLGRPPKECGKCLKTGSLKIGSKMLKLINHVLCFKLQTKYKHLLEINQDLCLNKIMLINNFPSEKTEIKPIFNLNTFECTNCQIEFPKDSTRYKCSICSEYFLCEYCENITNHDHIFIKITGEISTKRKEKDIQKKKEIDIKKLKAELKFSNEVIYGPENSTVHQIVEITNKGEFKLPDNVFICCISGPSTIEEYFENVKALEPKQSESIHLPLKCPPILGWHSLGWRLMFTDEKKEKQFIGNRIDFKLFVEKEKDIKTSKEFAVCSNRGIDIKNQDDIMIFGCNEEIMAKSKQLHIYYPQKPLSYFIRFLNNDKFRNMNIETIIEKNSREFENP